MLTLATIAATVALAPVEPQAKLNKAHTFEGKAMPSYNLKTTVGTRINNKNMAGKVVLFDFWATWCGACKKASPTMQALHKANFSKGLRVVGASVLEENPTALAPIKKYQDANKYSYTFTYDGDSIAKSLGITSLPAFVLVGKNGKVVKSWEGWNTTVQADIKKHVAQQVR